MAEGILRRAQEDFHQALCRFAGTRWQGCPALDYGQLARDMAVTPVQVSPCHRPSDERCAISRAAAAGKAQAVGCCSSCEEKEGVRSGHASGR